MADGKKHTKRAANIIISCQDRFLVLWRRKWEADGTPLILPGGEINDNENQWEAAVREVKEETGIVLSEEQIIDFLPPFETKWTKAMYTFFVELEDFPDIILEKNKFFGYLWIPAKDNIIMSDLVWLMMPGVKSILEEIIIKIKSGGFLEGKNNER